MLSATWEMKNSEYAFRLRGCHSLRLIFPNHSAIHILSVRLSYGSPISFPLPHIHNARMLDMYVFWPSALSLTATHAIASLSFPPVTEMFHFTGFASLSGCSPLGLRVAPFGYPRLNGYLLLIVAFRSLSRPSSLSTTKASTKCPYYLNYCALSKIISNLLELFYDIRYAFIFWMFVALCLVIISDH